MSNSVRVETLKNAVKTVGTRKLALAMLATVPLLAAPVLAQQGEPSMNEPGRTSEDTAGPQTPRGPGGGAMGPGMMGQGMGPGMMGQGMGPGMMGQGMGPGMMGQGRGPGMMGQGMGPGRGMMGFGGMHPPRNHDFTAEEMKEILEGMIAWHGHTRLQVGEVTGGDETITAEIETVDGSLVHRLEIDPQTGAVISMD